MRLVSNTMGNGPPVIILHGLYGSSDNWISVGKALSEDHTVYLVDQRNHGRSPHGSLHSYEAMSDDLYTFFNEHNIEHATLIGHSMGGKTAMLFASAHPERVDKLIVVDIAPKKYNSQSGFAGQISMHKKIVRTMMELEPAQYKTLGEVSDAMEENIKPVRIRQFLLKNLDRDKEGNFFWNLNIEVLYENIEDVLDGYEEALRIIGKTRPSLPALFIKGELSDYILESDFESIRYLFPGADIKTIKKAGHWVHAEQPKKFMNVLFDFLR